VDQTVIDKHFTNSPNRWSPEILASEKNECNENGYVKMLKLLQRKKIHRDGRCRLQIETTFLNNSTQNPPMLKSSFLSLGIKLEF
jgi:hypothetical protein